MKYNVYLVNVINSKDHKFLCRIQRSDARSIDIAGDSIAGDSRFKNEGEMRRMLKGQTLVPSASIGQLKLSVAAS